MASYYIFTACCPANPSFEYRINFQLIPGGYYQYNNICYRVDIFEGDQAYVDSLPMGPNLAQVTEVEGCSFCIGSCPDTSCKCYQLANTVPENTTILYIDCDGFEQSIVLDPADPGFWYADPFGRICARVVFPHPDARIFEMSECTPEGDCPNQPPCKCLRAKNSTDSTAVLQYQVCTGAIGNISVPANSWSPKLCGLGWIKATEFQYGDDCRDNLCPTCYQLVNCEDASNIIYTDTPDVVPYIGQVISLEDYPGCWLVQETQDLCVDIVEVLVCTGFESCDDCLSPTYQLTDCQDPDNTIITKTNIQDALLAGSIVKIDGFDTCWIVSIFEGCSSEAIDIEIVECFSSCELCLQIPEPPVIIIPRERSVRPGYNTPGCRTDYYDRISCRFVEAIYSKVISLKYGIESCCNLDLDKLIVKKELLDLSSIYDPEACIVSQPICCPPCRVSASIILQPLPPDSCPAPFVMSSSITTIMCIPPYGISTDIELIP